MMVDGANNKSFPFTFFHLTTILIYLPRHNLMASIRPHHFFKERQEDSPPPPASKNISLILNFGLQGFTATIEGVWEEFDMLSRGWKTGKCSHVIGKESAWDRVVRVI